jgi:hypothetical protein
VARTSPQNPPQNATRQSPQLPVVGPATVPERHVESSPQKPQSSASVSSMQERHSVRELHGSTHCRDDQRQFMPTHDPSVGPLKVPVRQLPVFAHQPHRNDGSVAHETQSEFVAQVSGGGAHSNDSHFQSGSTHVPSSAPVDRPRWQVDVLLHHPQRSDESRVQLRQSVLLGQLSVPAHSADGPCSQPLAHSPDDGPATSPSMHAPVAPHHPHPIAVAEVHALQSA